MPNVEIPELPNELYQRWSELYERLRSDLIFARYARVAYHWRDEVAKVAACILLNIPCRYVFHKPQKALLESILRDYKVDVCEYVDNIVEIMCYKDKGLRRYKKNITRIAKGIVKVMGLQDKRPANIIAASCVWLAGYLLGLSLTGIITQNSIAEYACVSEPTLRKHTRDLTRKLVRKVGSSDIKDILQFLSKASS